MKKISFAVKQTSSKTSAEQEVDPREEEEILSLSRPKTSRSQSQSSVWSHDTSSANQEEEVLALSPQPSIISTVTHGATKKNVIHASNNDRDFKSRDRQQVRSLGMSVKIHNFMYSGDQIHPCIQYRKS